MDQSTDFGYIKARLEDISRVQGEQRQEIQEVRSEVASLRVEIGALKATARVWGMIAGALSGILSALAAVLGWRVR